MCSVEKRDEESNAPLQFTASSPNPQELRGYGETGRESNESGEDPKGKESRGVLLNRKQDLAARILILTCMGMVAAALFTIFLSPILNYPPASGLTYYAAWFLYALPVSSLIAWHVWNRPWFLTEHLDDTEIESSSAPSAH